MNPYQEEIYLTGGPRSGEIVTVTIGDYGIVCLPPAEPAVYREAPGLREAGRRVFIGRGTTVAEAAAVLRDHEKEHSRRHPDALSLVPSRAYPWPPDTL
jgi:hypothetical protein